MTSVTADGFSDAYGRSPSGLACRHKRRMKGRGMTSVEAVLAAWRDAERLLGDLPAVGSDHDSIVGVIVSLRTSYERITDESTQASPIVIAETRRTIASSRDLMLQVRTKAARADGSA